MPPVVDWVLGDASVALPEPEHEVGEAGVALPRPLELEHGVHQVGVALEDARVPAPDVGRAQDQAAVVREEGGQARAVPWRGVRARYQASRESDVFTSEPTHQFVNTRGPYPARSLCDQKLSRNFKQYCEHKLTSHRSKNSATSERCSLKAVARGPLKASLRTMVSV